MASRPGLFNLSIYGSWYRDNQASTDVDTTRATDTANAWSVPVPNGTKGTEYVRIVGEHLARAIERARPDIILYQAGADPYREDPYSPLDVGLEDLAARDRLVFETARDAKIPVAWVLAGGYTKDVSKVVAVHVNTARAAVEAFPS